MKYNQLAGGRPRPAKKRPGRGIAAGGGKTAGRGTKGQNARSGGRVRPYFEGGQTPLVRRLPKLAGFRSRRPKAETVYTGQLDGLKAGLKTVDNHALAQAGLISGPYVRAKLIKRGALKRAHDLRLQAASAAAQAALLEAGGRFKPAGRPQRPASEKKRGRAAARAKNRQKGRRPPK